MQALKGRVVLIDSFEGAVSSFADETVYSVFDDIEQAVITAARRFWLIRQENRGLFDPLRRETFIRILRREHCISVMSRDKCRYSWRIEKCV